MQYVNNDGWEDDVGDEGAYLARHRHSHKPKDGSRESISIVLKEKKKKRMATAHRELDTLFRKSNYSPKSI